MKKRKRKLKSLNFLIIFHNNTKMGKEKEDPVTRAIDELRKKPCCMCGEVDKYGNHII